MTSLLLGIIYLAFISLGLPDTLLGAAWPAMYPSLSVPVASAGLLSMLIAASTIISSLLSGRVLRRFGTSKVTLASVSLTAVALLGFSLSGSFWALCLWAVPYGLGAGSVDAALNHYVALHYSSRHMNWLHCFWGVGATVGPTVMGFCLARGLGWPAGYRIIGLAQVAVAAVLALSLPLWKKMPSGAPAAGETQGKSLTIMQALRLPGARLLLPAFFCYCALEATSGLWIASYLTLTRGFAADLAAQFAAVFYLGITVGRLLSGWVSNRLGNPRMVRGGQILSFCGLALFLLAQGTEAFFISCALLGLGCAPVFPALLHETPVNFGKQHAQTLMGMQMASAYLGTTLMPPLFGLLARAAGTGLLPYYLLVFTGCMTLLTEAAARRVRRRGPA